MGTLRFLLLTSLPLLLFLSACGPKYGPAYLGSNNAYMAKPAYKGTRVNTVSVNGRYNRAPCTTMANATTQANCRPT